MTQRHDSLDPNSLDPESWRRIDQILDRIFDSDEADRESILDDECGDDEAIRRQVESLLAAESRPGVLDSDLSDEPSLFARALDGALDGASKPGDADTMTSMERRFGPYRVVRMLGAGGMGVVYEGWDTRLERPVAIKVLPQGVSRGASRTGAEAEERFLREARAASALDHANICSIYDIGVAEEGTLDEGRTFLVMALYRGETLRERIERGPLDLDEAVDLARQIARGLARAHEANIVHRDIKPANVFVTEHGEAKILDFGLAKVIDEAGLTRTGEVLGTPAYMPPEQLLGQEVDARADIWAFGVLLYRMIGGARPFPATAASLNAVLSRDPEPLLTHRPEAPRELAQLVECCLAKDPDQRPQSMREILDVLGDTPTATTRWTQTVQSPDRSKRRELWAAAAMVLVVVVAVGWRLWDRGATPESRSATSAESTASVDSVAAAATESEMESEPTGLVVLPFNDLTPDPDGADGAGLGRVITEMLVTDLRGSPDLAVASTSRLHRALEAVGWSDDAPPSPQTMRRMADEVGRDTVLHGSYILNGDRYRILATLESMTGESVLMSKQVESTEAGLFNAVDELSLAVRDALRARSVGSGGVAAVTTSSLDAMAAYTAAMFYSYDQRDDEALASLDRALALDPDFAMAWRRQGLIQENVGQQAQARQSLARAFELAERLPPKQRVPVRADFYSSSWSTLDRTIDVYLEGLARYPRMTSWRNNLGYNLAALERYEEAVEQFEKSIELGTKFGWTWVNLGLALAGQGHPEAGVERVAEYADRHPGEATWRSATGWLEAIAGDYDAAMEWLEQASTLVADEDRDLLWNRWRVLALRGEWSRAADTSMVLAESKDPESRRKGRLARAKEHVFHGRSEEAIEILQGRLSDRNWSEMDRFALLAEIHLARLEPQPAVDVAKALRRADPGGWFERRALELECLAQEVAGNSEAADSLLRLLSTLSEPSSAMSRRQVHYVEGKLARVRGDATEAVEELSVAAALLPPRGINFGMVQPPHVDVWYQLGMAHLDAEDHAAAAAAFHRAVSSGSERLAAPLSWSRSLYWLSHVERRLGKLQKADQLRDRFLELRRDGDLDRQLVEKASLRSQTGSN